MNNLKQLETREVNVGENIFYIRPLPAFKAANMTGELAALVLPLVSGLAPLLSAVDTAAPAPPKRCTPVQKPGPISAFTKNGLPSI